MLFAGFLINVSMTAANVAMYLDHPNPISAAAAVICGSMALFVLALAVKS